MGSLMAGWDSRVPDPKDVKLLRNKSLIKEEIEAYWRLKKQKEEEHLRAISDLSAKTQENKINEADRTYKRSISLPSTDSEGNILDRETEPSPEKLIKKNGWWISSNWAFLNEPPVIAAEGPKYKYASQYHVATISATPEVSHV